MSHMMKGKTSLTVENSDCIEEALKEAMPQATILTNEIAQIGRSSNRARCEYVIRRSGQYDIGLKAKSDGTYEILGYNPGYGDRNKIDKIMSPVYTAYVKGVVKKEILSGCCHVIFCHFALLVILANSTHFDCAHKWVF